VLLLIDEKQNICLSISIFSTDNKAKPTL